MSAQVGLIPVDGTFEVRSFEATDEPAVLEVLRAAFGQWPGDIQSVSPSEFFRWKHNVSPFGRSSVIVAAADGEVIGCHAFMPWRLAVSGRAFSTLRGVDLAVHPSYQRRGVSTAMRSAARFPDDVAFMWSIPNEQNRPGAHNAGMRPLYRPARFVRPRGALSETVRRAWGKGSMTPTRLVVKAETAAEVLGDHARASLLLARIQPPDGRMATVKDLNYLRWRYGQFEEYRAIMSDSRSSPGGITIFRVRRHGPFWVSDVCELLVEQGDRQTARHLLQLVREAAMADFITCSFPSRQHAASFGFLQTRGPLALMTLPLQPGLIPDHTTHTPWALSRGDLELL